MPERPRLSVQLPCSGPSRTPTLISPHCRGSGSLSLAPDKLDRATVSCTTDVQVDRSFDEPDRDKCCASSAQSCHHALHGAVRGIRRVTAVLTQLILPSIGEMCL